MAERRALARWLVAGFFLIDGVLHLTHTSFFAQIVPPWVPAPATTVVITGVLALAGGVGLLAGRWRRAAGVGLALYCAAVYPANIHHTLAGIGDWGWGYHAPRLLLQPVIAWACLWVGEVIDWPFAARR